jgi:transcriptional regulator with XRE-family HTH domain
MKKKLTNEQKAFLDSLESYETNREEHPDDETQAYFVLSDFILEIISLRRKKGLTQEYVANKMETQQAAISRFEHMNINPSLEFMYKITKVVGGKLDITASGDYNYIVPEKYREKITEISEVCDIDKKTILNRMFEILLEKVCNMESGNFFLELESMFNEFEEESDYEMVFDDEEELHGKLPYVIYSQEKNIFNVMEC